MLRSLLQFDWQESPVHLLLLSKFLHPRIAEDFSKSDNWKTVLGESPEKAINRFLDEGVVTRADLGGHLAYKFKANELKTLLKQRGLPVSGNKDDLILRLIQADPEGMKKLVTGLGVLQCSERGRDIAEKYLTQVKEKQTRIEEQVLGALRKRRFKEASQLVASFEAEQVFPRGLNIDWKHHDPAYDVVMLGHIFNNKPKILAPLSEQHLETLRVATGMMFLWGTNQAKDWLPSDLKTGLLMDNDAAARMLWFHAHFLGQLASFRSMKLKRVRIRSIVNDQYVCDACRKIDNTEYELDEVPELPYEKCTSQVGCRCDIRAVVDLP